MKNFSLLLSLLSEQIIVAAFAQTTVGTAVCLVIVDHFAATGTMGKVDLGAACAGEIHPAFHAGRFLSRHLFAAIFAYYRFHTTR